MELLEEVMVPPVRGEFEDANEEPEFEEEEGEELAEGAFESSMASAAEEWEAEASEESVGEAIDSGEAAALDGGELQGFLSEDQLDGPPGMGEAAAPGGARRTTLIKFPRHGYGSVIPLSAIRSQLELDEESSSGASGLESFEIFPPDERRLVSDTSAIPFRFICALDLIFPNPGTPGTAVLLRGSGTLISNRHVLTAGHNVFDDLQRVGLGGGAMHATGILAAPGRHDRRLPFGRSRATQMRTPTQWTTSRDSQFDFALLTLADSLGGRSHSSLGNRQLGYWGHPELGGGTRLRPLENRLLEQGPRVNVSGYPIDKCRTRPPGRAATAAEMAACALTDRGTTQWSALGRITHPNPNGMPRNIGYDLDTAAGHSGGPVWLRWQDFRNMVAVNTGGLPADVAPFNIVASMGTRITEDVLAQLRTWMRADGVSPSF